jgi:pilus assembly protein CpaB
MKFARIAVHAIAINAGVVAAILVSGDEPPPPPPQIVQTAPTAEVLVAAADIGMGEVISSGKLSWRPWPESGVAGFITRTNEPGAMADLERAIARQPFVAGEPIRMQKIVKSDGSGFMWAILPSGMRAIATEISAVSGAGGFILPNDRVDVILTRKAEGNGDDEGGYRSETILTNVRVLAIDQTVAEKDGQKVVVGRTATLELLPEQTEDLALARQLGTLSLALRALVDSNPSGLLGGGPEGAFGARGTGGMTVIRYGIATNSIER